VLRLIVLLTSLTFLVLDSLVFLLGLILEFLALAVVLIGSRVIYLSLFTLDTMSILLAILRVWIIILIYLASMGLVKLLLLYYNFYIMAALIFLILSFSMGSLINFYIFFEAVLIPIVLLIFK